MISDYQKTNPKRSYLFVLMRFSFWWKIDIDKDKALREE